MVRDKVKLRKTLAAATLAVGLLLCLGSLLLSGWAMWQIYGIGGWRDEVYGLNGAYAAQQALSDFRQNKLRLYVLGNASDRAQFTGSNDGPFELWTPAFHPGLGQAQQYSTEQFIEFYNRKMRYMHSNPEDLPRIKEKDRKEKE